MEVKVLMIVVMVVLAQYVCDIYGSADTARRLCQRLCRRDGDE
jgi:hypothetical protein